MMTLLLNETTHIWMHICSLVLWILTILLITYLYIKQHKKSGQKKYFVMIPNSEMGYSDVPCVNSILDDNLNSSSTVQCRGINRKGEIINSLIIPKKIDGQDKIIDYLCIVNVDKDTQFQQVLLLTIRDSNSISYEGNEYHVIRCNLIKNEKEGEINAKEIAQEVQQSSIENQQDRAETIFKNDADTVGDEVENDMEELAALSTSYTSLMSDETFEILSQRIKRELDNPENICSPVFDMKTLVKLTNSNAKYVSIIIHDVYGDFFRSLLNKRRIELAKQKLDDVEKNGNKTIQSIALEVGYSSINNFINTFKKMEGVTPAVYQRNAINKYFKKK